jgi:hypothetical protein
LIGEKLIRFAEAAEQHPEFAKELPRFLAAIWRTFNEPKNGSHSAKRAQVSSNFLGRRGMIFATI